jgi:hypothetical protein
MLLLPLLLASPAFAAAGPDLTASVTAPASTTYVYQSARWYAKVTNGGSKTASAATVSIQLPETHTSPSVYVLGTLGAKSSSCTASGTKLNCTLGAIKAGKSVTVYFDLTLPESTSALEVTATAATTTAETSTSNNSGSATASLTNYAVSFTAPRDTLNRHCTGTSLTSFYECELFPSSISSHEITLNADGSVSFATAGPEYTGVWTQPSSDSLTLTYYEYGTVVAEFEGYGVDASCWEGMTTFPGSAYLSMYEVCLQ